MFLIEPSGLVHGDGGQLLVRQGSLVAFFALEGFGCAF
jgi:hypothetical protein